MGHHVYHTISVELLRCVHKLIGESSTIICDNDEWVAEYREHVRYEGIQSLLCGSAPCRVVQGEFGQRAYCDQYMLESIALRQFSLMIDVNDLERSAWGGC